MYYILGLGNPGEEYDNTRHNTGRIVLSAFLKKNKFPEPEFDKKLNSLVSTSKLKTFNLQLIMPETFMNKSGQSVGQIKDLRFKIKGKGKEKKTEIANLIVIHDDLDIPFGKFKVSFNKSSGGHKGVESIIKAVKTEAFVRIRVGICPASAKASAGKPVILKKPQGEKAVGDFILAKFKPAEIDVMKKVAKDAAEAIAMITEEGKDKAAGKWNSM